MKEYKLFLNGSWVDSTGKDVISVENPATKKIIAKVPAGKEEDVNIAVQGALEAFEPWRSLDINQRLSYVEKMYQYLESQQDEIGRTISEELGSPIRFATSRHVSMYLDHIKNYLSIAKDYNFVEDYDGYRVIKEPVGVVGCLTPWNYPFGQIVKKVIPALLAGNTVILKPSRRTPLTAYYFAKAAMEANLPKGVFQLIPGRGGEVGNILASHKDVNMISFTGSTSGGKEVASLAIQSIKRLALELGGKSAALFLEGANYEKDIKKVLDTVYLNTGQTCSAKTRMIAPRKDKEIIEEILIRESKKYRFGDPMEDVDVGPLQSQKQWDKVDSYIKLGKEEANLLYQGDLYEGPGYYITPVIFTDVDPNAKIAQEEIFGPVLSVIYYDSFEEGIHISNNSIYGLSGFVFGPEEEAYNAALRIRTGQIQVNRGRFTQNAPFGGFKQSGLGREGSIYGFEEFLEIKTLFL
ncbi:MAG: aldehyde dehydrogenase family protein [Tissierellia bacterium]|nr:aldehyde dehydrogenase family protein [Tissierellia bacterium]